MARSRLINRNVTASRGRTSMRLEPELWDALQEICRCESVTLADLVKSIERAGHPGGRTSAVRVHLLSYFRNAAHMASRGDEPANAHPVDEAEAPRASGWRDGHSALDSSAA